ncbi:hypothetical protein THAOC_02096 [Thalassiosira oceanica]|uniref:Uncharacterized protein n=1 Tax=Thalassiosira oceanica TaxID=159749 RepID=K0TFN9_THAOC|nr:hypothetical protein THAOC_02096 [Thalassiosira oceanica]|eukprot:EJK76160.1 hypothetical protein THAOC_02096 [Thalassiosira oceanica]
MEGHTLDEAHADTSRSRPSQPQEVAVRKRRKGLRGDEHPAHGLHLLLPDVPQLHTRLLPVPLVAVLGPVRQVPTVPGRAVPGVREAVRDHHGLLLLRQGAPRVRPVRPRGCHVEHAQQQEPAADIVRGRGAGEARAGGLLQVPGVQPDVRVQRQHNDGVLVLQRVQRVEEEPAPGLLRGHQGPDRRPTVRAREEQGDEVQGLLLHAAVRDRTAGAHRPAPLHLRHGHDQHGREQEGASDDGGGREQASRVPHLLLAEVSVLDYACLFCALL